MAGLKDVMIAVVVGKQSLFLPEFFEKIHKQDYPKEHIFLHVTVQNATKYEFVKSIVTPWSNEYR